MVDWTDVFAERMDSSLAGRQERVGPVEVGDIKKDLLAEFSAMPTQVGPPRSALTSDTVLPTRQ